MFKKIKEFFTGSKPAVEATQEVPLTTVDVAIKNIKETTASLDAKVEVAPETTSEPAPPQQAWTKNSPAPIAKTTRKKPQTTKATTTAPKKRKPTPK
jgi:hypothetical protein